MLNFRPEAPENKVSTKEDWELCYLRHAYLRKVTFNPSTEELSKYDGVVINASKNTYFTYRNLLACVGMELDDVINIGRVHVISFIGLFSLQAQGERLTAFTNSYEQTKGKTPTEDDILSKNRADLTLFLKQRMQDLVRTCRQKARNIRGFSQDEYNAFEGPNPMPDVPENTFFEKYKEYGFRRIDGNAFRAVKNKANPQNFAQFEFGGLYYIAIVNGNRLLTLDDFIGADINPHDTLHYMAADDIISSEQDTSHWKNRQIEFNSYGKNRKNRLLKAFIENHVGKPKFKDELKVARKLLEELRVEA